MSVMIQRTVKSTVSASALLCSLAKAIRAEEAA